MVMDDTSVLVQCDFEVYGHVQGRKDCDLLCEYFFMIKIIRSWIHETLS
jgi:hypothetical protein